MKQSQIMKAGLLISVVGLLILRAWWVAPVILSGGPHAERFEKRGGDYSLNLKIESEMSDVLSLDIFSGYSPSIHFEYEEGFESQPARYGSNGEHHSYTEYILDGGRIQFHHSYEGDLGAYVWCEFLPSDLTVDDFLNDEIAISLDMAVDEFKIHIKDNQGQYMTIKISNRKISRISWHDN